MITKMKNFVKDKKDKARSYHKRRGDAVLAHAEGYAEGTDVAAKQLTPKIQSLTTRINELATENLKMSDKMRLTHEKREDELRNSYAERINILDNRHTKNCKDCMGTTEMERERLRSNQNTLLDLIQSLNIVYMKLFKHASLITDEHDNILRSSGKVKASGDILLSIRKEIDVLIKKSLPLLDIAETEQPLLLKADEKG